MDPRAFPRNPVVRFSGWHGRNGDGTLWVGVDGGYLLRYDGKELKTI